jgi:hypothetical protein
MVNDKAPQSSNAARIRFMRLTLLFYLYRYARVAALSTKHVVLKRALSRARAWGNRQKPKISETKAIRRLLD